MCTLAAKTPCASLRQGDTSTRYILQWARQGRLLRWCGWILCDRKRSGGVESFEVIRIGIVHPRYIVCDKLRCVEMTRCHYVCGMASTYVYRQSAYARIGIVTNSSWMESNCRRTASWEERTVAAFTMPTTPTFFAFA